MNEPAKERTLDELLELVPFDIPTEQDPGEFPEFLKRDADNKLPVDGTPDKEEQEDPAE